MKSAFTHWAKLEAARDDSSMNLNYEDETDRSRTNGACVPFLHFA